jgi:hypothetical protein
MTRTCTLLMSAALIVTASACTANAAPIDTASTASVSITAVESNSPMTTTPEPSVIPATAHDTHEVATATDDTPTAATEDPTSSQAPVSPSPLEGFDLAGQDLADAQAAWQSYTAYRSLSAQARANPSADWSAQFSALSADPMLTNAQTALNNQVKLQTKVDDQTRVEIAEVVVEPDFVVFSVCVDTTNTTVQDKDGKDVKAPDAPGSYYRHPGELWLERQNGTWLIVDQKHDFQAQC